MEIEIIDCLLDAIKDTAILLPFLYLTYLLMEYLEHKTNEKVTNAIKKSGKLGSLIGSMLGLVPQCGFSASATALFSGRVITIGTLISIYLTTSDEMLPILITSQIPLYKILAILGIKFIVGLLVGFIIDFIFTKNKNEEKIENNIGEICKAQHCNCSNENIFISSFKHTISIAIYIFLITFVINIIISAIGEENLQLIFNSNKILGPVIASLIGLIPNCASSVILSQIYVDNIISISTLISGLLVNAGIGLLILFKTNKNLKENIKIVSILYVVGVVVGIFLNIVGFNI